VKGEVRRVSYRECRMPFNLGIGELLLVMVIFLLVFGAKRLPEIGAAFDV